MNQSDILFEIEKEFNCNLKETSNSRKRELVLLRSLYFKIQKFIFPTISLVSIGKCFNKDHATVINALSKFESLLCCYPEHLNRIKKICDNLRYDLYEGIIPIDILNKNSNIDFNFNLLVSNYTNKVHESNKETFLTKLDALCELNKHEIRRR